MSTQLRCGYCGPKQTLPTGYDYFQSPYKCLTAGINIGTHTERRKWQRDTGHRIDPEYISPCPRRIKDSDVYFRRRNRSNSRNNRSRTRSRSRTRRVNNREREHSRSNNNRNRVSNRRRSRTRSRSSNSNQRYRRSYNRGRRRYDSGY